MRVAISGGNGFIGTKLVRALVARGDDVTLLVRKASASAIDEARVRRSPIDDARSLDGADAIVNLAGAGVLDERWTEARLRVIRESRIETTRSLVARAANARVLVSASAIGFYGMHMDDAELDESSPRGDDVLARICDDWENEARKASCRVAIARIGIVLGKDGGALARMLPMFRRFLGGPLGDGKQWWSWIHVDDVVRALLFAIDHDAMRGAFNATAPAPATMNEVARTLGEVLHRPSALRVPAFALRAALGDAANVLLTGQRVLPRVLTDAQFEFRFRALRDALAACV